MQPENIFTPRSPTVNKRMYVPRPDLERSLKKAVSGSKHILIHGESGNGKSWLYKSVFQENSINYVVVNLSLSETHGSISDVMDFKLSHYIKKEVEESELEIKGGASLILEGHQIIKKKHKHNKADSFLRLIQYLRKKSGSRKAIIVFDNFEYILSNHKLVKELASYILLLDDEDYAKYNVKLCVVGTPDNAKDFFSVVENRITIANRIREIPEVANLPKLSAIAWIKNGLFNILKYKTIFTEESLLGAVAWMTDYTPQSLHELCLQLSQEAEHNNRIINKDVWKRAVEEWVGECLSAELSSVSHNMNAPNRGRGRKDQTLYTLAHAKQKYFSVNAVESALRAEFPNSTNKIKLNISQILSELSKGEHAILRKTPTGNEYRFRSPKLKMCLRSILLKDADERVYKFDSEDPDQRIEILKEAG